MSLSEFASRLDELPTLPAVATQINIETKDDALTAKGLSEIVSRDPALATKVLKLANSAYYGLLRQVTSIDRAITMLGFNTITNLALTLSVFKLFTNESNIQIDMEGLWHHSVGCASATKILVSQIDPSHAEEAFLGGLLHDIGIIAMIKVFPDKTAQTIQLINDENAIQSEAESRSFGFTHQEAGSFLAEQWNFPEKFTRSIRFHHDPFVKSVDPNDPASLLIYAVYVGNQITKSLSLGRSFDTKMTGVNPEAWKILGITPKLLLNLKNTIRNDYQNTVSLWGLS